MDKLLCCRHFSESVSHLILDVESVNENLLVSDQCLHYKANGIFLSFPNLDVPRVSGKNWIQSQNLSLNSALYFKNLHATNHAKMAHIPIRFDNEVIPLECTNDD